MSRIRWFGGLLWVLCAVLGYQSMGLIDATEQYRKAETVEYAIQYDNRMMSEGRERETGGKKKRNGERALKWTE